MEGAGKGPRREDEMKAIETVEGQILAPSYYLLRQTPFGPVAVLWSVPRSQPKIERVLLSRPGTSAEHLVKAAFPDSLSHSCAEVGFVADQIAAFLTGHDLRFSLDIARLDLCSRFQQKVLRAEYGIPRGSVSTYQRIAGHLGDPKGARAVGAALANNPFPIIIPCHRAIRSDGTLGGYQGGLEMKQALLEREGVRFDRKGRVLWGQIFY